MPLLNFRPRRRPAKLQVTIELGMTTQQQVPANSAATLRAHAKSPFYVVIAIQKITDPEAYKPLPEKGKAAAEAAGGHYIIRTDNITGLDGVAPERLALIEFDSIEKAWYAERR
jgi:uncharacterized protein (DUF1330 family)